jgi:hypothetical protein
MSILYPPLLHSTSEAGLIKVEFDSSNWCLSPDKDFHFLLEKDLVCWFIGDDLVIICRAQV